MKPAGGSKDKEAYLQGSQMRQGAVQRYDGRLTGTGHQQHEFLEIALVTGWTCGCPRCET